MGEHFRTQRIVRWCRARGPDLFALAVIAVVAVLVWYFRVIRPAHIHFDLLSNADFFTQIYPMWLRTAEWWRDGVLPLWNPYQYAGHPLLACAIYGVLYPPNVLYWFVPTAIAIEMLSVAHLAVAGFSMYAYAATIGLGRAASFVAGATFMLSGFVMSQATWFPPALAAAVWLPLALLALERLFRRADIPSALLLALAVALPFLGGWPQTWMYSMYVIAVYGIGRFVVAALSPEERRHLFQASALAFAAALVAACWMAPQLLPSLELQGLGPRRTGALSILQSMPSGPLAPHVLLASLLDATPGRARWGYVGIGSLLLIPLSLVAGRHRWRVACFGFLAVFSLLVALSLEGPILELYRLIGGSRFRIPARVLFIHAVAASILVAVGFDFIARLAGAPPSAGASALSSARMRWLVPGSLAVLATVGVSLLPLPPLSRLHLVAALVLACGALLAPWAVVRRLFVVALAGALVVDLGVTLKNPFLHPFHGLRAFDAQKKALDYIEERQGLDRTYIISHIDVPEFMSKQGSLREIYSITDYEPLSLSRYDTFFRMLEPPKDRRPDQLTFTGTLHADPTWAHFHLLDLLSVRFVLLPGAYLLQHKNLARLAPKWQRTLVTDEGGVVFENSDFLPRAYVVQQAIVARSEEAALAALTSMKFDPRTSVILEPEQGEEVASAPLAPVVPARILRYEPAHVSVEVDAPEGGWLVLTDTYYPGWQATVDGEPTEIVRANFLFRGVRLGAGTQKVEFTYRPRSFWLGAAAALLGLAVAALALAVEVWRRARARARRRRAA